MNPIVKVERLSKTYGTTIAVDEVTFDVQEGETRARYWRGTGIDLWRVLEKPNSPR